mmetsp:Transcript_143/g.194  ORF Transcript_143/g.194 Transcript_143/m.194 type:complete len:87 (-) Transcript_143:56-316(-)
MFQFRKKKSGRLTIERVLVLALAMAPQAVEVVTVVAWPQRMGDAQSRGARVWFDDSITLVFSASTTTHRKQPSFEAQLAENESPLV